MSGNSPVMHFFRFILPCLLLLCSCNTYRFADKQTAKALTKKDFTLHSLDTEKYIITYWDSETEKPVLILLHGFGTSGKFQWYKQAELSKQYRVVIVNLLYFGSNPKTPDHSMAAQVDALYTLTEKLHLNSFYLCGSSYGGVVAAEFALSHPGKIKKLVLMDVPLKYLTTEDTEAVCRKHSIGEAQELFVPSSAEMMKKLSSITYARKQTTPMFLVRQFYENNYNIKKEDLISIYQQYLTESIAFARKDYKFKMPVLLIWGEKEELVPLHVGEELQKHIGNGARLETVAHAAHLPNLENPSVVKKLLLDFLN